MKRLVNSLSKLSRWRSSKEVKTGDIGRVVNFARPLQRYTTIGEFIVEEAFAIYTSAVMYIVYRLENMYEHC